MQIKLILNTYYLSVRIYNPLTGDKEDEQKLLDANKIKDITSQW